MPARKRKRMSKKKRQRMMVAYILRFIVFVLFLLILAGICYGGYFIYKSVAGAISGPKIEQTTVEIRADGRIVNTIIEDFDENIYSADELKNMIDEEVADYNAMSGEVDAVVVKKFEVKKSVATAIIEMASVDDYKNFNSKDMMVGHIGDLVAHGVPFDVRLIHVNDGDSDIMAGAVSSIGDHSAAVVTEQTTFRTPEKILYHSENIELISDRDGTLVGEGKGYIIY